MNLPNAANALVEPAKITDYLLSPEHLDGRSKADFFGRFGFQRDHSQTLADALRRHGASHPVAKAVQSPYGMRYSVDGELETPDGRTPRIRSVWIREIQDTETTEDAVPRLITAHPI